MKRIISLSLFAFISISLIFSFSSCLDNETNLKSKYTIKGHVFYKTTTNPLKNQELEFNVYQKGTTYHSWVKSLGIAKTDDKGYFEFNYEYQRTGNIVNIGGQFTDNNDNPINTNIEKDFYNSLYGTVVLLVNTNNKLTYNDTLFIQYFDQNNKPIVDSIIGNYSGYFKTIRIINMQFCVRGGKGYKGFRISYDPVRFYGKQELDTFFSIKGEPYVDTAKIKYWY